MQPRRTLPCINLRLTGGKLKQSAALMVAICLASIPMVDPARAELSFEDFTDGNLSDSGIDWLFNRDHAISADGLLLSTPSSEMNTVAFADWPADRPGWSIRTKGRLLQNHGFFGAATAASPGQSSDGDTWNLINASGNAMLGSGLGQVSGLVETDLRPFEEDVIVQLDTLDDVMRMWVWRDGEQPTEDIAPLIEERFDLSNAAPALWARSNDGPSSFQFRWIATSTEHLPVNMPVPEPSAGILLVLGLVGLARIRKT